MHPDSCNIKYNLIKLPLMVIVAISYQEQLLMGDLTTLDEHVARVMSKPVTSSGTSSQTRKHQEEVKIRNEKISAHKAEIGAIERKVS
jgi:hypothetical protein